MKVNKSKSIDVKALDAEYQELIHDNTERSTEHSPKRKMKSAPPSPLRSARRRKSAAKRKRPLPLIRFLPSRSSTVPKSERRSRREKSASVISRRRSPSLKKNRKLLRLLSAKTPLRKTTRNTARTVNSSKRCMPSIWSSKTPDHFSPAPTN